MAYFAPKDRLGRVQRAIQRKPKLKEAAKADDRSLASFVRHALRKRHNSSATKV